MEYNQYWNEIKDLDENQEKKVQNDDVISFSYGVAPSAEDNVFDDDEIEAEEASNEVDDSIMYSNSSLFDLIDEIEEAEEAEKEERAGDSRFINFDFRDDIDDNSYENDEDDVHIFEETLEQVLDEVEEEEDIREDNVVEESEPEPVAEPEPVVEPEPVAEPVVEPEPVAEPEIIPHFEAPVFEEKEETDIDQLIEQAKKKEEESTQRKLLDSELLPLLREIILFMPGECKFVDYIAKLSNEDRKDLVRAIDNAKSAWLKNYSDKMFTIADGQLTIGILSDVSDPMRDVQRLESVGAQMFSYDKESWNFVKLYFDNEGKFLRADSEDITQKSFNSWQWKVVQTNGFNLWKSRQ